MKKLITVMAMVIAFTLSMMAIAFANFSQDIIYEHDFSDGIGDWRGDGSIEHNPDAGTATIDGFRDADYPDADLWYLEDMGVISFFGTIEDRLVWPEHGFITEIDVFLDPDAMEHGDGFDLQVPVNKNNGFTLQSFVIHVGMVDDDLLISSSHFSSFTFNAGRLLISEGGENATVTDAGWYTFQHSFYELNGALAADLNVFDSEGEEMFTNTLRRFNDHIADAGYVRHMWFTYISTPFDIDNQLLANNILTPAPESRQDCMKGGFENFGFSNPGQCIAGIQANENARRP